MEDLIRLEGVTKEYLQGDIVIQALRGIDLSIKKGEFVSVMGPSGCGKSTLMHILGFLARPTGGKYLFEGRNSTEFTDDELALTRNQGIGFIFQSFNLLPRTSVLDNVLLPTNYSVNADREAVRKTALQLLETVGLSHRLNNNPNQLSGGEQQRVAIARSLINSPSLILADEPTGNLDSKATGEIMDILTGLHRQGNTILMVTHEDYLSEFTDRTIRVKDGQIVG
ncbi:macrolide ABC transporter ATP-binding protein [Candidatus Uhrbacteria bacterium CG_4_10_14_0_8_um_filter_58_22]|uniref:Macrolide ABC transporter ATP-binding protein n=1 Tax=Candidatus Uhrbacteria bacterium CG_4_10_14_0_8_um_filter_58_22 TaxID=1975029 RepID=A0A2M7QBM1_9BACT|nr:MAG: macrolide ABC transporter ATP-binding protein [Parcubacteria group bacterium CG1_02_58_44]PIY63260.1 MAG: macrolide ABC transporter ATP-binding protein [Candidatus Uhrbacteria bacterium CG_4_10_14_0_8_um_filter_58_22]